MKSAKLSLAILGSMLLLSSIGYAQEKGTLSLDKSVSVHNTVLKPGTYKTEWSVKNSSVEVRFIQGKNTVASAHGTIVSSTSTNGTSGYESTAQRDGADLMTAYSPENKKYKISFDVEEAAK